MGIEGDMVEYTDCPKCHNTHTVGYGYKPSATGKKHRRLCKACDCVFIEQNPCLTMMKHDINDVELAVGNSKYNSLRGVVRFLSEMGIEISHQTVADWKKKFADYKFKEVEIVTEEENDEDWMYRPMLNTNTRTNYDGNRVNEDWME